jgi:RecA-family ATPase
VTIEDNDGDAGGTSSDAATSLPEIPWRTSEVAASWRRVLDHTVGDKRSNFRRAAIELLRPAENEQPPERRAIIDLVASMGTEAGLDDDTVQAIMSDATMAPHDSSAPAALRAGDLGERHAPDPAPLDFFDPTKWAGQSIPRRKWLVSGRLPREHVTMLAGDGAAGKTTITLQLVVATVRGLAWLGALIEEPGPAIFFTAEEDQDEIHRRFAAINEHHLIGFGDLPGVHLLCMPGADCVLGVPDRAGLVKPTPLFASLLVAATKMRPALIAIEAAADVYAGDENNRSEVRQFIGLLRRLAIDSGAAVLLIAHPSLSGLASGSGTSGSTAWSNSVRSRLYFATPKNADGGDGDVRELTVKKSNYGPAGEVVRLRWARGVFVADDGGSTLERVAAEAAVEAAYLDCLDAAHASGRHVGPHAGKAYAPALFQNMPRANGHRVKALAAAQERLFNSGRIQLVKVGPPSKALDRIVRTPVLL